MNRAEAHRPATNWPRIAKRVGITLLAVLLLAALVRSAGDVKTFVGVDLVPKIRGAQRFFAHESPYVELTSEHTRFLPDAWTSPPFSRCSYAPTTVLFYRIGAWSEYRAVRYAWAGLEWASLLASIGLSVAASTTTTARWATAFVGIVFFACSYFFRLHVERGQYYVFVTLFWALAWAAARRRGLNSYATGFFLGMAAAMRPTSLPALLALAIFGCRRALGASFLTFGAMIAATLVVGGPRAWTDFVRLARYVAECVVKSPGGFAHAAGLAGYDAVAGLSPETANTSLLQQLLNAAELLHVTPSAHALPLLAQGIVAATMLLAFVWMAGVREGESDRRIMLWSLVIALVCDYASPVRFGYADVLYLVPLAVALPYLFKSFERNGLAAWTGPLVLAAWAGPLVLSSFSFPVFTDMGGVSTWARTACTIPALALLLVTGGEANRPRATRRCIRPFRTGIQERSY